MDNLQVPTFWRNFHITSQTLSQRPVIYNLLCVIFGLTMMHFVSMIPNIDNEGSHSK